MFEWAARLERFAPRYAAWAATEMVTLSELRKEGIARLRRELERLEAVEAAARHLSIPEHRTANRLRAAPLLASLGRALAAEGDTAAAREALDRSAHTLARGLRRAGAPRPR